MMLPIEPQASSGILYFTVCLLSADNTRFASDVLLKVRRDYFTSKKKQKDKIFLTAQGESIRCFYAMENNKPLKWKKESEGRLSERAVTDGVNGYCIETLDYSDAVNKKMYFSNQHVWLRSEYFDGFNQQAEHTLVPWMNEKSACLALYKEEEKAPVLLQSVPLPLDKALLQSLIEEVCPQACAQTSAGLVYFCAPGELALWKEKLQAAEEKQEKTPAARKTRRKADDFHFDIEALQKETTVFDIKSRALLSLEEQIKTNKPATPAPKQKKEAPAQKKVAVESKTPQVHPVTEEVPAQEKKVQKKKPAASSIKADKIIALSSKDKCLYFGALDAANGRSGQGRTQTPQGQTLYDGMYENDMRNGFGAYYFKTGRISYLGNWKDNKRAGFGVAFRPTDGSVHVGVFENDAPQGIAARFDKNGRLVYAGNWTDGTKTGAGITVHTDGTLLVSKWENGKQKNTASILDDSGAVRYSGEIKNGLKEGKGSLFGADGALVYTGTFKNDCYNGTGRLYLADGSTVTGSFTDGVIFGKACKYTSNGALFYDGMWEDNLPNGQGTLYAADGSYQCGYFTDGKAAGEFSCFSRDGQLLYKGMLTNGLYDGKGLLYANGELCYDGAFACGEKSGMGREFADGECVYMGTFVHNLPNGFGVRCKNGAKLYGGFFKDGVYHGKGVLFDNGAPLYAGSFADGKLHGRVNRIQNNVVAAECIYQSGTCVYEKSYASDGALLYEGNSKDGKKEGMGCAFTAFGEKSFEGIFKYNEPFKSMKVITKIIEPLPYCEKLKNTEYESFRIPPFFAVEEPLCGGMYSGMLSQQGIPHGRGTMLYPDHRYTGVFENGIACGQGVVYFGDGRELQAHFLKEHTQNSRQLAFAAVSYDYIPE